MIQYLGDGVYLRELDYGGIELTTEDGERATNTIYLEREVMETLYTYLHKAIEGPQE